MDEYVSGAILRLDEPVTLGRVEPLDCTGSHYRFLSRQLGEAPPHAAPLEKRSQCLGRNLTARSRGHSVQQQRLGNAGRSIHAKSKRASAPLRAFEGIVADPDGGRDRSLFAAGLRSVNYGRHVIFFARIAAAGDEPVIVPPLTFHERRTNSWSHSNVWVLSERRHSFDRTRIASEAMNQFRRHTPSGGEVSFRAQYRARLRLQVSRRHPADGGGGHQVENHAREHHRRMAEVDAEQGRKHRPDDRCAPVDAPGPGQKRRIDGVQPRPARVETACPSASPAER